MTVEETIISFKFHAGQQPPCCMGYRTHQGPATGEELLVKSLLLLPLQVNSGNFIASKTAEDSCRIVSRLDFFPVRSVTPEYIDSQVQKFKAGH